jgi:hypothetical protein
MARPTRFERVTFAFGGRGIFRMACFVESFCWRIGAKFENPARLARTFRGHKFRRHEISGARFPRFQKLKSDYALAPR